MDWPQTTALLDTELSKLSITIFHGHLMLRFKRFQSRLLFFMLTPFLLVSTVLLTAIDRESQKTARANIDDGLAITARTFNSALTSRRMRLIEHLRASAADFGFKSAIATRDPETISSALENYSLRVSADVMIYVDTQQTILGEFYFDEMHRLSEANHPVDRNQLPVLLREAQSKGAQETESIEFLNGTPYQLVVLPIRAPLPVGWLIVGFKIDQVFVEKLKQDTHSDISILSGSDMGHMAIFASTVPEAMQQPLVDVWQKAAVGESISHTISLESKEYVILAMELPNRKGHRIIAILQRSLAEYLEPYEFLRYFIILLFIAGTAIFALAGVMIARSVTKPVKELAQMAQKVREGDYSRQILNHKEDEIGFLAESFNHMTKGLAERNRILGLLGKVVSEEVATELLKGELRLGGETREVTVLFADLRGFTSLCEDRAPEMILNLLNRYLTVMTSIIEKHSGVVDKYMGDAIMALFGAPVKRVDDAQNAISCALEMCQQLVLINEEFSREGLPLLTMGIGINTGETVAGNMGSESRHNYTVIGDSVNLSSRLEGLTKVYGVPVIVSDSTRSSCPEFIYRELDRVQVKGRREPLTIYQPLGLAGHLKAEEQAELALYEEALAAHRERNWKSAMKSFNALQQSHPDSKLYLLYVSRVRNLLANPPFGQFEDVIIYDEK
jgi:adenylate cyclase